MLTIHLLANGLVLIVEEISGVESVAYDLHIPGGILTDPHDQLGSGLILSELTSRGAGELNARDLSEAFESLGISHGEYAGSDRFFYRGSMLAENLPEALKLVSMMVLQPTLPEEHVPNIQSSLLQDLISLDDNPGSKISVELAKRYFPAPYNRPSLGTRDGIKAASRASLLEDWKRRYHPNGSILSIAGKVNTADVIRTVEKLFNTWEGETVALPKFGAVSSPSKGHIDYDSAQVQIALVYPSVKFGDVHFYDAKVATGILSGGMFGRLFIEVREKRGLCYSVYAKHAATKDFGAIWVYAATTTERAPETYEVTMKELNGLAGTITADELSRSKANIKTALILGEESTGARASSNAGDWWLDRKVRSLLEIQDGINAVSTESIDKFLRSYPLESITLLTLGKKSLLD